MDERWCRLNLPNFEDQTQYICKNCGRKSVDKGDCPIRAGQMPCTYWPMDPATWRASLNATAHGIVVFSGRLFFENGEQFDVIAPLPEEFATRLPSAHAAHALWKGAKKKESVGRTELERLFATLTSAEIEAIATEYWARKRSFSTLEKLGGLGAVGTPRLSNAAHVQAAQQRQAAHSPSFGGLPWPASMARSIFKK